MNVVSAALAQPPDKPPAEDAKRVTITLSDGTSITGSVSPAAVEQAPGEPVCITITQGSLFTNVFVSPEFIASAIYDPMGDDKIVPAHLRAARA